MKPYPKPEGKERKPPSKMKVATDKQAKRLIELRNLKSKLLVLCNNKSELSGESPDWQSGFMVEPHHICGRVGGHLLNPFEIVMVTRDEHTTLEKHKTLDERERLLAIVKILRLKQGFKESDYA